MQPAPLAEGRCGVIGQWEAHSLRGLRIILPDGQGVAFRVLDDIRPYTAGP